MSISLDYTQATFLVSASRLDQCPADTGAEIAFAGRSNAGKSSAINTLTQNRKLARTSKTPGRTQLINFFSLNDDQRLVDLPGYGYAKVPEEMRNAWGRELTRYLGERHQIRGLFAVMDSRHAPTILDEQLVEWFGTTEKPIHVLLTKSDKLTRNEANKKLKMVSDILCSQYSSLSVQLFSSSNKTGVDEARQKLIEWLS